MVEISVIIPALNEEKYIPHAIAGLKQQTFKDFEVIVSDGGSTDRTREIVKGYAKVVIDRKKGMAAGRNAGARVAKGKILVFLDADTRPGPGLLSAYSAAFKKKGDPIAATGPILPMEKNLKRRIRWGYSIVSVFFVKLSIMLGVPSIVGSNFAIRRSIFEKVHGFDSNLRTYEDWDLSAKLKKHGRIAYVDDAIVYTSARRVVAWGVWGYFKWHAENVFMYYIIKRPKGEYPIIR